MDSTNFFLVFINFFSLTISLYSSASLHNNSVNDEGKPFTMANSSSCPTCLLVKSSTNTQTTFPWLFNNDKTRFLYTKTDINGWPVYEYIFTQTFKYYLHFYDEGLFYDGFYVINDLEDEYVEIEGRVFIYNSDSDDCPDMTGRNWYYWYKGDWLWDDSIYLQDCRL